MKLFREKRGSEHRSMGRQWTKMLSNPGAPKWEDSTKDSRRKANRRDRHNTKAEIKKAQKELD